MDRSVSFSSGRSTRDTSPTPSELSSILARLESQTSALGHIGIVKWQRNDLQKQLAQQKGLTVQEQQTSAKLRQLALRLAAKIAVRESQLKSHAEALSKSRGVNYIATRRKDAALQDLEKKIQDDLVHANALLRTLGGSDSIARYDGAGFHVASRPLSPPLSPFKDRRAFGRTGNGHAKSRQLPSEILQLCKTRAESLLLESSESRHTINTLEQDRLRLTKAVNQKDNELAKLQASKAKIEESLDATKTKLQSLTSELASRETVVDDLNRQKCRLQQSLTDLQAKVHATATALETTESQSASVEAELSSVKTQLKTISSKLTSAETRIVELETSKAELEAANNQLTQDVKDSSDQNEAHIDRRRGLEAQAVTYQNEIEHVKRHRETLESKQLELEETQTELERSLSEKNIAISDLESKLSEANSNLISASDSLSSTLDDLSAQQARCKDLVAENEAIDGRWNELQAQHERSEQMLAISRKALQASQKQVIDLDKLHVDLKNEVMSSASRLSDYAAKEIALQSHVDELENSIAKHQSTIDSLRSELSNAQDAEAVSSESLTDVGSQLAGANEKLNHAEEKYIGLSKALELAEQCKAALELDLQQAHVLHDGAVRDLQAEKDQHGTEKTNSATIQRLLSHSQAELESSQRDVSELRLTRTRLEQDIERGKEEQLTLEASLTAEVKSKAELKEKLLEAERVLGVQKDQFCSLKNSNQDFAAELERIRTTLATETQFRDELREQLLEAERVLGVKENQMYSLNNSNQDIAAELEQIRTTLAAETQSRDELREKLLGAERVLNTKENQIRSLKSSNEDAAAELEQIRTTLATETQSRDKLKEQMSEAERILAMQKEQIRTLLDKGQDAALEMKQLHVELKDALGSRNVYRLSSESAEEKMKGLESQISSLGLKMNDFQNREREVLEAADLSRSSIAMLEQQLEQSEKGGFVLEGKLEEALVKLSTLQRSKVHLEAELQSAIRESQELQAVNQTLREELTKVQKDFADLQQINHDVLERLQHSESIMTKVNAEHLHQMQDLRQRVQATQDERLHLEHQLSKSEAVAAKLKEEIKSLSASHSDTQAQLRRNHAVRRSSENALGALRVRLGASKMAKRGVEARLSQAERDLEALYRQRDKLEDSLAQALDEAAKGHEETKTCHQRIEDLQSRYNRLEDRLAGSEDMVRSLRETVQTLEINSSQIKQESARRQERIDQVDIEIKELKVKADQMAKQHAEDRSRILAQDQQIQQLQEAKISFEKTLKDKMILAHSQEAKIAALLSEGSSQKDLIASHEADKAHMRRLTMTLEAEVKAKENAIGNHQQRVEALERERIQQVELLERDHQRRIESLGRDHEQLIKKLGQDARGADERAKGLESQLQEQKKLTHRLRVNNDKYEKDMPALRDEIKNLEAARAALEDRLRHLEIASRESQVTQESSPTLVTDETDFAASEEAPFDPSSRPMSPTRVNTGHSSMKAFRVLGAEAAAGQPGMEEDDIKKELWDLWASQHKLGPVHEEANIDSGEQTDASTLERPRFRRKLTKKQRVDDLKTGDGGKLLHKLMRFGSARRPPPDAAPMTSRSLSYRN